MSFYGLLNTTSRDLSISHHASGHWEAELSLWDVPHDGYVIVGQGYSPDAALQDAKRKFDAEKEYILKRITENTFEDKLYDTIQEFLGSDDAETEEWYQKLKG